MIKSLVVRGLHGKFDFDLNFNEDINIITGKNGSGKTSILKMMWYLLSGRNDLLYQELDFSYAKLEYDNHTIEALKTLDPPNQICVLEMKIDTRNSFRSEISYSDFSPLTFNHISKNVNKNSSSIFFPTFRRIEGGFGILKIDNPHELINSYSKKDNLEAVLSEITTYLSSKSHKFVIAISTHDIQEMLVTEYFERLEKADKIQQIANQEIAEQLKLSDSVNDNGDNNFIKDLKLKMEDIEKKREELMLPFESLSNTVSNFFHTKGIEISDNISFGEKTELLSSDKLSAGEKQMLSFLSYNAFTKDAAIFIDEPELSLHVDWQRQLLPTLMKQGTKNQFFIATHSPFIYGMYPDKEIELIPNTQSVSI